MIQISVSPADIKAATLKIENKVKQAEFAVSPMAMTEIAKAAFTITAKKFIQELSLEATQNPKKYHHLYEWNKVGNPSQKLFILKRMTVQYGKLTVRLETTRSSSFVPIREELLQPGPTGKTVSSRHIFKDKASVMEEGRPVRISSSKIMVFYSDSVMRTGGNGLVFIPSGQIINVRNPGGTQVKGALRDYSELWYATRPAMIIEKSRLFSQIGNAVAKALNMQSSSPSTVIKAIQAVTAEYSQEISVI